MNREREEPDFAENQSLRHLRKSSDFLANDVTHECDGSQTMNVSEANRCITGRGSDDADSHDVNDVNDDNLRVALIK